MSSSFNTRRDTDGSQLNKREEFGEERHRNGNIANLDILPTLSASKQLIPISSVLPRVSEINAENATGVNRVIAEPERLPEPHRRSESRDVLCRSDVPRLSNRTVFKRRRVVFRRFPVNPPWTMLHRSRPDLIKSISTRPPDAPTTSNPNFADALSQSASENSLLSSGSAESHSTRPRPQASQNLSRTSSIGDASGSSTPTQSAKPIIRKKEAKRAEIVASVTSRLYAIKKRPDPRLEALQAADKDDDEDEELEELKLCKRARMKLFDLSRKLAMAKKLKRTVDSDTQTEFLRSTLRVKEKSIATDQQGVLHVLHTSTNTPSNPDFFDNPEPPVVMNQVYLPSSGNFVLECGSNLRVALPNTVTTESASQTKPEYRDQTTSPKKLKRDFQDDGFSDDSLDSDDKNKSINSKYFSCNNLPYFPPMYAPGNRDFSSNSTIHTCSTQIKTPRSISTSYLVQKRSTDSLLGKLPVPGVRLERNLQPICRYVINGTNALYEYDPNKKIPDTVVFSNFGENKFYHPQASPTILYPQYTPELSNDLSIASNDTLVSSNDTLNRNFKFQTLESNDDNLSSGTSSASTASSSGSDTSSDDFVFFQHSGGTGNQQRQGRELYTISENSEQSYSNQSTPLTSRSPRPDKIDKVEEEHDILIRNDESISEQKRENLHVPAKIHDEQKRTADMTEKPSQKKTSWAEMQCHPNRRFLNFNFKPSFLSDATSKDQSIEANMPSEDSITFVFLGPKEQQASVLLELIKRSLMGGSTSDEVRHDNQSKNRGVQCSSKLMRSVSEGTAMIALSRLARHQRPATDMTRTNSLNTIMSEELQMILDQGKLHNPQESSSTQCDFVTQVDESTEVHPQEISCQCNLGEEDVIRYSSATNTTKDQETVTEPQKREEKTQTEDLLELFEDVGPELPRRALSPVLPGVQDKKDNRNNEEIRWLELKRLILGTRDDLFPSYLASEEEGERKSRKSRKCVSWSDFEEKNGKEENSANESENTQSSQTRRVRFFEPHDTILRATRNSSPEREETAAVISSFITEATSLLKNLRQTESQSDFEDSDSSDTKLASCSLLRRRDRKLSKMKIHCGTQNETTNQRETSVQTDVEKTDRVIQTGGFASSLVGPSIKRCLTPNFKMASNNDDNLNMTWPRRHISGKPPTGLKPGSSPRSLTPARSGSFSSRLSTASTNWTFPSQSSPRNSPRRSPIQARSVTPDFRENQDDWQVEESCKRLEFAIQRDRSRQENLSDWISTLSSNENLDEDFRTKNSTPEDNSLRSTFEYLTNSKINPYNAYDSIGPPISLNTDCRQRKISLDFSGESARATEERKYFPCTTRVGYRHIDTKSSSAASPDRRINIQNKHLAQHFNNYSVLNNTRPPEHPRLRDDNLERPTSLKDNYLPTPEYFIRPINPNFQISYNPKDKHSSPNNDYRTNVENTFNIPKNSEYLNVEVSQKRILRPPAKQFKQSKRASSLRRRTCICDCHNYNLSCSELDAKAREGHCHTCCVPCARENDRLYHSEPVLCLMDHEWKSAPKSKYTPSAHLRYLVALRKSIVAGDTDANLLDFSPSIIGS